MDPWVAVLAAAALAAVVLYVSAARNPIKKCPRCEGRGVLRSVVMPWRVRPCPRCGRSSEVRARFGGKS